MASFISGKWDGVAAQPINHTTPLFICRRVCGGGRRWRERWCPDKAAKMPGLTHRLARTGKVKLLINESHTGSELKVCRAQSLPASLPHRAQQASTLTQPSSGPLGNLCTQLVCCPSLTHTQHWPTLTLHMSLLCLSELKGQGAANEVQYNILLWFWCLNEMSKTGLAWCGEIFCNF